ncbi:maleylpyruvate isomerase family mycothiol-dependent enzyme [Paramicrobacterium sp. CJ85]|uniref:maleylpyruvate isomerase family mycothiol-dependent enzyme n=1 Tax=Paramicrobacterium sp. CJ85 TaxID=3445355 RepID=UPI003F5E3C9B
MTLTDTGARVGAALAVVRDGLARASEKEWAAPSLCDAWSVKEVVSHLVWRISSSPRVIVEDLARASVGGHHINPHRSFADIAIRYAAEHSSAELLDDLTLLSRRFATGDQRAVSQTLVETVVHGFDAAHPLGVRLAFAPEITYSVARLASKTASRGTRTVLRHRVLTASDDGWSIGTGGDEIIGTAESVILYLAGRRSTDPRTRPVRIVAPLPPGAPAPGFA